MPALGNLWLITSLAGAESRIRKCSTYRNPGGNIMAERYQNYIDGAWVDSASSKFTISKNPADHLDVLAFPKASEPSMRTRLFQRLQRQRSWRQTSSLARGGYLLKTATTLREISRNTPGNNQRIRKAILESRGSWSGCCIAPILRSEGSNPVGTVVPS
ncbi:MAG: hypothetical protein Ct9H300mP19_19580 [Dehalococcoidia bacterium]|nr:MAG: hypothetical protein Ct9H300mP19_19580 [Dehalococcoidia bacterium]